MSGVIEHQAIGCKGSRKIINRCSTMNRSVPGLNLEKHSHGQRRGATNLEEKWSVAFVSAVSNARMDVVWKLRSSIFLDFPLQKDICL